MVGGMSVKDLILEATLPVQGVMVILLIMSIASWAVMIAKSYELKKAKKLAKDFDDLFWHTPELTSLYNQVIAGLESDSGNARIFEAGFKEFIKLKKQGVTDATDLVSGTQRAMKVAFSKEVEIIENRIPLLATVGSSAPYIGLFGTVWGVMHAFSALGSMQNATLAAIAPGISEALIATAIGLFVAIPAVIAYNRLSVKGDKLITQYENFAEGFLTIIQRQGNANENKHKES